MYYQFSYTAAHRHLIDITCIIDKQFSDTLRVNLPAWRPGRYELGNFAKNIQQFNISDENNKPLAFKKITKDCWEINCKGINKIKITYSYYAAEINAGSSYLDENQLYVNPVNCCIYADERMYEACDIELVIPKDYMVATALTPSGKNKFKAANFHQLADSPFLASKTLKHNEFSVSGVKFHLWFQGDCSPDWSKLLTDFYVFAKEQILAFGDFPASDYHFIFQILPYKFYHGVEHLTSTVIALGPSHQVMEGFLYDELLGVSSHELYHAWNIKSIRPKEMMPYNYKEENYSRLGYVCEGVTTYYGDYILFRSGIFNQQQYFNTFNERLNKHFHNPARLSMSVADASFDTWLDGYVAGIPNRKTSIYDEGCLLAFATDILIRKETNNHKSLDDVMLNLYNNFSKKSKGYTENDYMGIVDATSETSFTDFFRKYIYGTTDYQPLLAECLDYIGLQLDERVSRKTYEAEFGFKLNDVTSPLKITNIIYDAPADKAGLSVGDELVAINNHIPKGDLNEWIKYFADDVIELSYSRLGIVKTVKLLADKKKYYNAYSISKNTNANAAQKNNFEKWAKRKY